MPIAECPICHNDYEKDEPWKKLCYDCWKGYRYSKRIQSGVYKSNVYVCHPSVTKEELEQFIRDNKLECGWGVHEYNPEKFKIWVNSVNFD